MPALGFRKTHCKYGHSLADAFTYNAWHSKANKIYSMRQCRPCHYLEQKKRRKKQIPAFGGL